MATYTLDSNSSLSELLNFTRIHDGDIINFSGTRNISQIEQIQNEEDARIFSAMDFAVKHMQIEKSIKKLFGKQNCKFKFENELLTVFIYRNFSQEKIKRFLKKYQGKTLIIFKNLERNKMKFMVKVV